MPSDPVWRATASEECAASFGSSAEPGSGSTRPARPVKRWATARMGSPWPSSFPAKSFRPSPIRSPMPSADGTRSPRAASRAADSASRTTAAAQGRADEVPVLVEGLARLVDVRLERQPAGGPQQPGQALQPGERVLGVVEGARAGEVGVLRHATGFPVAQGLAAAQRHQGAQRLRQIGPGRSGQQDVRREFGVLAREPGERVAPGPVAHLRRQVLLQQPHPGRRDGLGQ